MRVVKYNAGTVNIFGLFLLQRPWLLEYPAGHINSEKTGYSKRNLVTYSSELINVRSPKLLKPEMAH